MNNKQFYTKQALDSLVAQVAIVGTNVILIGVHIASIMAGDTFQVGVGILGLIISMPIVAIGVIKSREKYEEVIDLAK